MRGLEWNGWEENTTWTAKIEISIKFTGESQNPSLSVRGIPPAPRELQSNLKLLLSSSSSAIAAAWLFRASTKSEFRL